MDCELKLKRLGDNIIFVDGHTRAFAAFLAVFQKFQSIGNMRILTEMSKICVKWCKRDEFAQSLILKTGLYHRRVMESCGMDAVKNAA
ncbi:MAG: hypothetical protein QXV65_01805 [Candidatus Bathyarchaeia archaeon]